MLKLAVPRSTPYFPSVWTEKQTKPHHLTGIGQLCSRIPALS